MTYLCIYFSSSTALYMGADALKAFGVPFVLRRLSENLKASGCTRCLKVSEDYRARAISALNEKGCVYLSIKAVK